MNLPALDLAYNSVHVVIHRATLRSDSVSHALDLVRDGGHVVGLSVADSDLYECVDIVDCADCDTAASHVEAQVRSCALYDGAERPVHGQLARKSTRLTSSHVATS